MNSSRNDDDVSPAAQHCIEYPNVNERIHLLWNKTNVFNRHLARLKSAYDVSRIRERASLRVLKQYLTCPSKISVMILVELINATEIQYKGAVESYLSIVQFLIKRFATGNEIIKLSAEVHNLFQGSMTPAEFHEDVSTRAARGGSCYYVKSLKTLYVEGVCHSICKALCY